jgi:Flp pilus assembly protein TadG
MRPLSDLWQAQDGGALIEFALVAPVAMLMTMGLCDVAYQLYMQSVLAGLVQKTARDATIQNATTATLDAKVLTLMQNINKSVLYASGFPTRESYATFGNIAPEPFTDSNRNGVRDAGECFTDVNGNSTWDADAGIAGNGGASDMVVYTAQMTYPHLFPVATWMGWPTRATISATTIMKNQPYTTQIVLSPVTVCI